VKDRAQVDRPRTTGGDSVIDWLLAGDPAIRWQVMRDLMDAPVDEWTRERRRTLEQGWVADLLARQGADGEWTKGRWTESPWTLLLLVGCGIPEDHPSGRRSVERMLGRFMPPGGEVDEAFLLKRLDLCHIGFWVGLGAHFLGADPRVGAWGKAIIGAQLDDGGWNCRVRTRPATSHGSFHTTFNVLEGLRIAAERGAVEERSFRDAEARAVEFMLAHRLYRSDKTGEIIAERFLDLTYPWHWHYTILRGLDYLRLTAAVEDERLEDAIQLLRDRRKQNGRWPSQKRIPGKVFFDMEKPGGDSRWNTLRALRVLRRYDAARRA
jgi:hypothetical protein